MRPSVVLDMKRSAVREAVGRFRAANPRVFGSVLHGIASACDEADYDVLLYDVGHIPGAVNVPMSDLVQPDGRLRPALRVVLDARDDVRPAC